MAKFDILELNYITDGDQQNTFNVSYCYTDDGNIKTTKKYSELSQITTMTFFGNKNDNETMSQLYGANRESFYDITNNIIIHNIYDASKIQLKSTSKKYSQDMIKTDDSIDLLLPEISSDFINVCQFNEYAYGLINETDNDPTILSTILDENYGYLQYTYQLAHKKQNTYLYFKPGELGDTHLSTYQEVIENSLALSNNIISSIFNIKRSLKGIYRNYIVEIPECLENKYENGYILADQSVTKNHLNYKYNVDISSDDFDLNNCRQYCGIDVCGNQLYLKYRDNVNYRSNEKKSITYYPNTRTSINYSIDEYDMIRSQLSDSYSYQHIEVINDINKYDSQIAAGHKSSMFSLKISNTGLNTNSNIPILIKEKLKTNITNSLRAILDNIIPANTQLFNIYFDGQ